MSLSAAHGRKVAAAPNAQTMNAKNRPPLIVGRKYRRRLDHTSTTRSTHGGTMPGPGWFARGAISGPHPARWTSSRPRSLATSMETGRDRRSCAGRVRSAGSRCDRASRKEQDRTPRRATRGSAGAVVRTPRGGRRREWRRKGRGTRSRHAGCRRRRRAPLPRRERWRGSEAAAEWTTSRHVTVSFGATPPARGVRSRCGSWTRTFRSSAGAGLSDPLK